AGLGKANFSPGSSADSQHSFPSNHTVLMWAAITPYAEEYGMPWLYGAAALTNLARIGSREHWVSDTVASSLIGYGLGYLAWDAQHQARLKKDGPTVLLGPQSVNLAWQLN
ncbi:MAG: phosphatase PAP2 family protein, partial [Burkholderiales bacterium]